MVETNWDVRLITVHIYNVEYQEKLIELLHKNTSSDYDFYTDGSLTDRGNENVKMGVEFMQTKSSNVGHNSVVE